MNLQEGFKERAKSGECWYGNHFQCYGTSDCACECHQGKPVKKIYGG